MRATVIIPTWNWSSVLRYSITSVLHQTMSDFELLVVGDCCTDDSEEVAASFGDPRVRWINLPARTKHQSGPNNEGLRQAQGEFIAYLGHDDLWLPHSLEAMIAALESTNADVAHGVIAQITPEGYVWPVMPRAKNGSFAPPTGMMHRRHVTEDIGGWRDIQECPDQAPDVELWRRMQARGYRFTFVPRLTGLKFPAGWRRDVYQTRPCHEQAAWWARIENEHDFEARQLVDFIVGHPVPTGLSYRETFRHFAQQSFSRLRRRLALRSPEMRARDIEDIRRFKGA